jgi:hypothetical protein
MEKGYLMSRRAKVEYFKALYWPYRRATKLEKQKMLNEFCRLCRYNRKYAIRILNGPPATARSRPQRRRLRRDTYAATVIVVLREVWEAAGYPWSVRLKALLPLWLPWIERRFRLTPELKQQLLGISPRQIDRRLHPFKRQIRRRIYGRTKPGTLLKHHIPIRTTHWEVNDPGWVEIDLVSHSGNSGEGEFIYSLNLTDIFSGWVETIAVLGKGQRGIVSALDALVRRLPFLLKGIDSDNGSEFINAYLLGYALQHHLAFTRGRPYKKEDNAHVEQKNWTHVRKLLGWNRYDTRLALKAINDLYAHELRIMMNWYQPSVKLMSKERHGSHVLRRYSPAEAPLDRLPKDKATQVLKELRQECDPFILSQVIDAKLESIWKQANTHHSPRPARRRPDMGYLFR